MSTRILVPLAAGFEEIEAVAIVDVLRRAELDVVMASLERGAVEGAHGICVEPDAWIDNGGDAASIRFYQGVLIVRAPDYVQRQIGGYPFAARRGHRTTRPVGVESRYVQFTAPISIVQNVDFGRQTVTGAAGGTTQP